MKYYFLLDGVGGHMTRRQTPPITQSIRDQLKKSTSDLIFDALRESILVGELKPGTQLIEKNLAAEFGVSKTPIREALHHLSHIGLVDLETARGATVHVLTFDEIKDIWEMREYLEPMALELSMPYLTNSEIELLQVYLDEARIALDQGDMKSLSQVNTDFHELLRSKADNHLLNQWLDSLSDRRRLVSMMIWDIENNMDQEWHEHVAILDAIKARDIPTASQALKDHIANFSQQVLAHLKSSEA
jgi:DNA-binding GntR family transcriptional regulator